MDTLVVRAVFKFKGTNNDELKFKKGDLITVTQKEDGGWWEGTLDGKTGWFPSNYVEEIQVGLEKDKEIPEEVLAKNIDYRQQVIRDLLEKEQEFVSDLRSLLNQYLQPLHHADILQESEYLQLVGNIEELIEAHHRLNSSLEDVRRSSPRQQRLGQVFLAHGGGIRTTHLLYWANHPKAVCILEKHREKLNTWLDNCQTGVANDASPPGLMVLTTGLSRPFRHLERLAGAIQEVEQHLEDDHPDRGDTQRSIGFYKDVAGAAARARRHKELELEILTGTVRGWEGENIDQMGDIITMGCVSVHNATAVNKQDDRYLVLFPSTLLILSVSSRMSAFIYEGKLPLSGLTVTGPLEDNDTAKNAFEISGPLIESIVFSCGSIRECRDWVDSMTSEIRSSRQSAVFPGKLSVQPVPPPHKAGTSSPAVSRSPRSGLASRGVGHGVQGWKMGCLRPAPPTRSFIPQLDKRNTLRRKEVETSSYEDDLQILRVIEAYCTSKQRQTITNSAMLDLPVLLADDDSHRGSVLSSRTLPSRMEDSIMDCSTTNRLDRMDKFEVDLNNITKKLEQETAARIKLQEIIRNAGLTVPPDMGLTE